MECTVEKKSVDRQKEDLMKMSRESMMLPKVKNSSTVAYELANDPRLLEIKNELFKVIHEHQNTLSSIRPSQSHLQVTYEDILKEFSKQRGGHFLHPLLGSGMGRGCLLELIDGSVKYDFSGLGITFGLGHPDLLRSSFDALLQPCTHQNAAIPMQGAFHLTQKLLELSKFPHGFLVSSRKEALDYALHLIFQKNENAKRLLAFENSSISRLIQGYPAIDVLPFFDEKDPQGSIERSASTLKQLLKNHRGSYSALCLEMVQVEKGLAGSSDFFKTLIHLAKEEGLAILIDEVQTLGRTNNLFAAQNFDVLDAADILILGDFLQIHAILFKEAFHPKATFIPQTSLGTTHEILHAITILDLLVHEGYFGTEGKIQQLSTYALGHLRALGEKFPQWVEGPFGYGLMLGFTPFKGEKSKVTWFAKSLFESGIITFPTPSHPNRLQFLLPPGGVTFQDLDHSMTLLQKTLIHFAELQY